MPVYEVTIGNHPPLGSLLIPRMAQHGLKPQVAGGRLLHVYWREFSSGEPARNRGYERDGKVSTASRHGHC